MLYPPDGNAWIAHPPVTLELDELERTEETETEETTELEEDIFELELLETTELLDDGFDEEITELLEDGTEDVTVPQFPKLIQAGSAAELSAGSLF